MCVRVCLCVVLPRFHPEALRVQVVALGLYFDDLPKRGGSATRGAKRAVLSLSLFRVISWYRVVILGADRVPHQARLIVERSTWSKRICACVYGGGIGSMAHM